MVLIPPASLPPVGPELLVGLDVDGTILTHAGVLVDDVRDAIRRLADAGAHVVIATGRGPAATYPVLEDLGIQDGFAVCSNGAITLELKDGRSRLADVVTFRPEKSLRILRRVLPDALFLVEDARGHRKVTKPFPPGELYGEPEVVDFEDLFHEPVSRVTLRAPDMESAAIHRILEEAGMQDLSYAVGWTAWVDIAPQGVSKATALEGVRMRLGVAGTATVTVGDGHNDHEMLEWAAWSVAMGQASEDTKSRASSVAPTVDDLGLVAALGALRFD